MRRFKQKKNRLTNNWTPIKRYTVEYIFGLISKDPESSHFVDDEGITIKLERIKNFYVNGVECVRCGVKGTFFELRKDPGGWGHVDLYGINEDGVEVHLTRDHILPKSRGGEDIMSNYQPMCLRCNTKKGNKLEEELIINKDETENKDICVV